jgi:hypothetical protein
MAIRLFAFLAAVAITGVVWPTTAASPRFYADDPLTREPETADAVAAQPYEIDLAADLLLNTFSEPGDGRLGVRAENVNTIDEVPDSSWFTNRIGTRTLSDDDLVRGPNTMDGPAPGRWIVIRPKSAGFAPGFTVQDARGDVWFLTFDSKGEPNAATGAIAVACRLFWALGYFQVESYLSSVRAQDLIVAETATIKRPSGARRAMTMADVERVLARAARRADGSYRVLAARAAAGRVLGGFRYHGTRPDDPNDIVPHEHRRELRALKVFGAWANLVDLKAGNTLDTVLPVDGRHVVRHYLQDVGSTFGTGANGPREWDEGWEYLFELDPLWKRLVSVGFYRTPWQRAQYEDVPEVGRFEGDTFDPELWRSRVPAAAVLYARDDDTFWAALRVAAFSDALIRAAARTAQYDDPAAAALLADTLIKRRDKITRAYLPKINPVTRFALAADGTLTFENAAVRQGVAFEPAGGYRVSWAGFDNATGQTVALAPAIIAPAPRVDAPAGLAKAGEFVQVAISAIDDTRPSWAQPVTVTFRRAAGGWTLVGLERLR